MTKPAEVTEMDDSQKLDLVFQRVEWLCAQVMGLMNVAQSNPMFRMAMNKAQKGASNG